MTQDRVLGLGSHLWMDWRLGGFREAGGGIQERGFQEEDAGEDAGLEAAQEAAPQPASSGGRQGAPELRASRQPGAGPRPGNPSAPRGSQAGVETAGETRLCVLCGAIRTFNYWDWK